MKIGTYAVERDYSHYVAYAAKTIFAVVSTATKGPIGVATVCTSAQDLVNKFGPLNPKCYGLYAGQYFLSQSSKLYFVRAAGDSAKGSSVVVKGNTSTDDVVDALTVSFLEKGTYFDGYTLDISDGVVNKDDAGLDVQTYTITIRNRAGAIVEIIKDIDLDELVVGYSSSLVEITAKDDTATALEASRYTFEGGNNGIDDIDAGDYINAAQSLAADTVDMNLFAVPGQSDDAVITSMLSLAEAKGDCLFLVDPPAGLDREGVRAWRKATGAFSGETGSERIAFNSSYGALYFDWVTIYDSVNKLKVQVPPSVVVAPTYAYSDRTSELWFAPAGLNRGVVRGVLESISKLSKADTELLYEDGINPLYDDPQVGLVIWGQKTLAGLDTALDRVNVRRLLNYLKRVITAACNTLTFEPNDRITWNLFEMTVKPTLESIKNRRGLYEYRIIKGEAIVTELDIDNYRMPGMIMIRPTKAAEEIPIYFTITSTGADFNEVLEANGVILD